MRFTELYIVDHSVVSELDTSRRDITSRTDVRIYGLRGIGQAVIAIEMLRDVEAGKVHGLDKWQVMLFAATGTASVVPTLAEHHHNLSYSCLANPIFFSTSSSSSNFVETHSIPVTSMRNTPQCQEAKQPRLRRHQATPRMQRMEVLP